MTDSTQYQMPDGHTLYRWTNSDGSRWACCGYDHGPMCRRCQPVDDVLDALLQNVVDGTMTCRQDPDTAQFEFKMTDEGLRQAQHVVATSDDPFIQAVAADLGARGMGIPPATPDEGSDDA